MSESTTTKVPRQTAGPDDGWCLEKGSWAFHRSAFRVLGYPLPFGEYGHLRRQIASGEAELLRFGDQGELFRTRLRDGAVLDVLARPINGKKMWHLLMRAFKPGGKVRAVVSPAPVLVAQPPAPPAPLPEPPAVEAPKPATIRRASTLTLGTAAPTAAEVLAARLRPKAAPPRLERDPVQKQAQRRR